MRLKYVVITAVALLVTGSLANALSAPARNPLPLQNPLVEKNFYFLSLLQRQEALRSALLADPELKSIAAARGHFMAQAIHTCRKNVSCMLKSLSWTDEEIRRASLAIRAVYKNDAALRRAVSTELPASGMYVLYQNLPGEDLAAYAWEDAARGLNNIVSVYGNGAPPRYPRIDSISVDPKSTDFQDHVFNLLNKVSASAAQKLFFEPTLSAAIELLKENHRDEAARFEPLQNGENRAVLRAIPSIPWQKYPYSFILVPGWGPEVPNVALSKEGHAVTAMAAERFHAGKAPLILVSGGFVHPSQTKYAEAIEMKKVLVDEFNVPEEAIIIDPHARHTTTNMRNAARLIYRYGVPMDKKALVVTGESQLNVIVSRAFAERCQREQGYVPYKNMKQLSDTDAEFNPTIESLQVDAMDPLDP